MNILTWSRKKANLWNESGEIWEQTPGSLHHKPHNKSLCNHSSLTQRDGGLQRSFVLIPHAMNTWNSTYAHTVQENNSYTDLRGEPSWDEDFQYPTQPPGEK